MPGVTFHWPRNRLPVRYWVAANAGVVKGDLADGLRAWEAQFLYGEFRGVVVADSASADVVVMLPDSTTPPNVPRTSDPPADVCGGETANTIHSTGPGTYALDQAYQIKLTWDRRAAPADIVNCLHRVVMHEIGHSLGILQHSEDPNDLMAPLPIVDAPSARDRATAVILYHTPANVAPAPAR